MNSATIFAKQHKSRLFAVALHLGLVGMLATGSMTPAMAQSTTQQYDIPAGPLDQVLTHFAKQASVNILFEATALQGIQSNGLHGSYGVDEGFAVLLQNSGHMVSKTETGYVLQRLSLPQTLEEVVVHGQKEGYTVTNATTPTKTDTPLMETPMTVEVVPQQVLNERTATSLPDALASVGVTNWGTGTLNPTYVYRGFLTTASMWNGFRVTSGFGDGGSPAVGDAGMDEAERVEVLKGPSSILYGQTEPGGMANVVTKKPQSKYHAEATVGVGSWSEKKAGVDVTGAMNTDKTVLGRVIVNAQSYHPWYLPEKTYRSEGIAPAVTWLISPQTSLLLEGAYHHRIDNALVRFTVPIDPATGQQILGSSGYGMVHPNSNAEVAQKRLYMNLEHQFNDDWSVSWKVLHDRTDMPLSQYALAYNANFPMAAANSLTLDYMLGQNVNGSNTSDAMKLDAVGHVSALGIKHTLLAGVDYESRVHDLNNAWSMGAYSTNFFNPVPTASGDYAGGFWSYGGSSEFTFKTSSLYLQDQMALSSDWFVLAGGRYERLQYGATGYVALPTTVAYAFSPRLGVLWRPQQTLSLYYNFSKGTGQNTNVSTLGPVAPEISREHEIGVKNEWMSGRLSSTFALFDLTKYRVSMSDPTNLSVTIPVSEINSKGFDFDLQGELTDRWSALMNYSHARPVVVVSSSTIYAAGQLMPLQVNDTFNIWSSYVLPEGWKVGGGANWASAANPGGSNTTVSAPSYWVASIFASYDTKLDGHKTTVQFNVSNLFNKKYAFQFDNSPTWGGTNMAIANWGAPRQYRLTLQTEF